MLRLFSGNSRTFLRDNARPGEHDERRTEVDRSRRRHRPDVDRVAEHRYGRQQSPDASEQRAHSADAVDATALRDQPPADGDPGDRLACRHSLHQSRRPRLESVC